MLFNIKVYYYYRVFTQINDSKIESKAISTNLKAQVYMTISGVLQIGNTDSRESRGA